MYTYVHMYTYIYIYIYSLWVSCRFNALFQNLARISSEPRQKSNEFVRNYLDFCRNIELEHLTKGDNHNSAFPHLGVSIAATT